jgi:hypothetical protein
MGHSQAQSLWLVVYEHFKGDVGIYMDISSISDGIESHFGVWGALGAL